MKPGIVPALLALTAALTATPVYGDVQITISDGQVSLTATNATVREILTEWARVGGTTVINAEKISSPPLTLQFTNEPEERALKTVLRSAGGFVASPRGATPAGASRFERIVLMPAGPPPSRSATPPPASFPQPQFVPPSIDDDGDDEDATGDVPAPNVVLPAPNGMPGNPPPMPTANPRGPVFNTYPPGNAPANAPAPAGNAPVGVSVPGMVVPAPAPQPGMPGVNVPAPDPEP